jgi:hypothetical protein
MIASKCALMRRMARRPTTHGDHAHNKTVTPADPGAVTITFAGSGDAFGSGGRFQACIHLRQPTGPPVLLVAGATSRAALKC